MNQTTIFLFVSIFLLSSCASIKNTQHGANKGSVDQTLAEPTIGHYTEATLSNTVIETMSGYIISKQMDSYDRRQLNHVYERGMSGQSSAWINPDTGNQFRITPRPAYSNHTNNKICREAEILAVIDGKDEKSHTTACRNQQNSWQLQN